MISLDGLPADHPFPNPNNTASAADGLLAIGGDLSMPRLIQAYRQGIFPWYSEGDPILWWSPDPRTVLIPSEIHVSRSLKRTLKRGGLMLTIDTAFSSVVSACAAPRAKEKNTWLLPEMRRAYQALHEAGVAHSFELWRNDELVGGLYGVAIGRLLFGESMFSRIPDASKIVMVYVCQFLQQHAFPLLDCQVYNPHLNSMGARQIPRRDFLRLVRHTAALPQTPDMWHVDKVECSCLLEKYRLLRGA